MTSIVAAKITSPPAAMAVFPGTDWVVCVMTIPQFSSAPPGQRSSSDLGCPLMSSLRSGPEGPLTREG
ncbi:hypothetical protein GCM10020367_60720 [Streptomyces sannanensis]|uniref:Uncharacterized protein n=1 Tax=Streptomyces sannanensis TaxID=285536 RepID=A0ABP6SK79_9ACTN